MTARGRRELCNILNRGEKKYAPGLRSHLMQKVRSALPEVVPVVRIISSGFAKAPSMAEVEMPRVFGFRKYGDACEGGILRNLTSVNVADYLQMRTLGHGTNKHSRIRMHSSFGTTRLLHSGLLQHSEIPIPHVYNKVFCSQWLSDSEVIFGTKCNKLVVANVFTKHLCEIPMLGSNLTRISGLECCGVHSISINSSRTLLATGGKNCNEVAIYSLPSLYPVCVGRFAHRDWIFGICWLDNKHFITGSRDTTIALWRVIHHSENCTINMANHAMCPLEVNPCRSAKKVRSLVANNKLKEFAALSLNSYLHIYDAEEFRQKWSLKLSTGTENVCLAVNEACNLYAVGSKLQLTLYDCRLLRAVIRISVRNLGKNIRSLSFNGDIVTLGNGAGSLLFYDCKANKFLDSSWDTQNHLSDGANNVLHPKYLVAPIQWNMLPGHFGAQICTSPAIYTHCYNAGGTALFAAGGPLPAGFSGSYAGIWL